MKMFFNDDEIFDQIAQMAINFMNQAYIISILSGKSEKESESAALGSVHDFGIKENQLIFLDNILALRLQERLDQSPEAMHEELIEMHPKGAMHCWRLWWKEQKSVAKRHAESLQKAAE